MPRPLSAREQEVLEFLVSIDGPGAEVLHAQASTAVVTGECDCGCGAISLQVDRQHTAPAEVRWPIETHNDPEDPEETLWLMLWSEDGWISAIEIAWISAERPEGLPSPEGFAPPSQLAPRDPEPTARELWQQLWHPWRN
jgi:hypothetical protein